MKKIEAIIRPWLLDQVKIALTESGVTGLSVTDVRGVGSSPTATPNLGALHSEMVLRVKIEIVVRDEEVEQIVSLIEQHAWTGEPGDGKIFVLGMRDAIRIRTEERGDLVL